MSQSDQLDFYGLYKQATCRSRDDFAHLPKPAFWQFGATRKYWAWERFSKISKYEALVQYVKKTKQTFPEWNYDPKGKKLIRILKIFLESIWLTCNDQDRFKNE